MLKPGRDYTTDAAGRTVFTAHFLRGRGYCCFQGCCNCPWGQAGKGPERAAAELADRLRTLQARLHAAHLPLTLQHYRDGVLRLSAHLPEDAPAPDAAARRRWSEDVQRLALGLLHLRAVAWPEGETVALNPHLSD